jgi:dTMP kinase
MKKNLYPGKFIVFEGIDGSGQTTQVNLLEEFLKNKGFKVLKTKEPTKNSPVSKKIQDVLAKKEKISPEKLQKLFSKDRKWHLKKVIIPALKKGEIVISDRYFFSTFSYGMSEGVELKKLLSFNKKFLLPDLVFFLDVSPEIALRRVENRGIEKSFFEEKEKLEKIYLNYKKIFEKFKELTKIYFINGERSIEEVFSEIKKIINEKIQSS